ncbi:MAG: carnitinyl-CoA dehydratase [Mesorhizobium sp.]|nr:MAG: carnitinyl-CoA dehydratase [Mesorhizobium sp.]
MSGIIVSREDRVLVVTLNRAPANAFDDVTSRELAQVMLSYQEDPDLRCAILTASGEKFFSGGMDLKWGADGNLRLASHGYGPGGLGGISELWSLTKPVIAALNGMAVGAGFEIAMACDLVVAADHVKFWLPEVQRGFIADAGGVIRLPRLLPYQLAMEMLLTCRWMTAQELQPFGIVNAVVPASELMDKAREYAAKITEAAPLAVQATKATWHQTAHLSVRGAFDEVQSGKIREHRAMMDSPDYEEGSRAFADKRKPVWYGK